MQIKPKSNETLFSEWIFFVILVYGKDVKALIEQPLEAEPMHPGKNTVTYEARLLKSLLLQLIWNTAYFLSMSRFIWTVIENWWPFV